MRILVAEDEKRLLELLRNGLAEEGHSVITSMNGVDALDIAMSGEFDALLLDVMLPGMDGFEVARRLRHKGRQVPILMLTARDAESDIIRGLDNGADDYVTKPFSFSELLARLRAVTRRTGPHRSSTLVCEDLTLDSASHEVFRGDRPIHLTRTEFLLLQKLMQNAGRPVSRQSLIGNVWGYDRAIENNTLDAFIRLLRQKVDTQGHPKLIQTVRGFGYSARKLSGDDQEFES
ncbi:two component transcriptional regulator, winged helix family [Candidatus Koribacter versatilis Ellin345]|uniref:Two component transcriptional regulator, winged helix family n=2 Tax=Candidatus Korobacter versatilis TaxID=658062 RepID=Q1IUY4_KORVE|nr:two component transcriptional regulator, winged helix family [Candidatus Koribacter versatilis Ellin345]